MKARWPLIRRFSTSAGGGGNNINFIKDRVGGSVRAGGHKRDLDDQYTSD